MAARITWRSLPSAPTGFRGVVGQHVVLAGGHAGDEGLQQGDVQPASAVRDLTGATSLCRALIPVTEHRPSAVMFIKAVQPRPRHAEA